MSNDTVTLKIFRYDPAVDQKPVYKTYEIPWREGMLLLPSGTIAAAAPGACPA